MKMVLASGNAHKVQEIQRALPDRYELIPQTVLGVSPAEETGLTFVENAIIKARHAAQVTGLPAIADDSGLEVDFLKGAPGIYSARYAGREATDADNNRKLLDALAGVSDEARTARFQCVIVVMQHALDPTPLIASGTWEGMIVHSAEGAGGFGYDPLFFLPDHGCTVAMLPDTQKDNLSHRGKAIGQLKALLPQ
ncbi:MAG: RdgB/HAM1 family non-canonical purine NTP pyrophosphatase [Pseudomonadota bacterium]